MKKNFLKIFLSGMAILGVIMVSPQPGWCASPVVHVIQLNDDMINPITAEYISHAIDRAEAEKVQCLVIKLDTPGGLLTSTRQIVKKILSAEIPVVVYIAPSGARAGSAGVFITYASHLAAMAPSTNIGAAHPVELGGTRPEKRSSWEEVKELMGKYRQENATPSPPVDKKEAAPSGEKPGPSMVEKSIPDSDPMSQKILEDTVAFVKTLAQKRNRNAEWAVKSVTQSASITEKEAVELGVVNFIAKDDDDLLQKLDGRPVVIEDQTVTLNTKGATQKYFPMDSRQQFFNVLANPNIAYILMILGFYGLLYEITHPGFGFPGILGAIALILAFFSMQTLPTNYAGLALILLGLTLFVVEAFVGFGVLTIGGVVSMFLGSLLLFDASVPLMRVSISIILAFTLTTAAITTFLVRAVILAHRRKVRLGEQGMVGERGEVYQAIPSGGIGKVFVHGEIWNATAAETLMKGEAVVVEKIDGLLLTVGKKAPVENPSR